MSFSGTEDADAAAAGYPASSSVTVDVLRISLQPLLVLARERHRMLAASVPVAAAEGSGQWVLWVDVESVLEMETLQWLLIIL